MFVLCDELDDTGGISTPPPHPLNPPSSRQFNYALKNSEASMAFMSVTFKIKVLKLKIKANLH